MDFNLKEKTALVTGASRGLGRVIALKLAAEGVRVAVNYCHSPDSAAEVVKEIKSAYGVAALAIRADMGVEAEIGPMFNEVEEALGSIDILVNNAAICPQAWVRDTPTELWEKVIRVNLTGPFIAAREFLQRLMPTGRPGRIVNITSAAAFHGSTTGQAAYDTSKGGINTLTVALSREAAPQGITVNALAPGLIITEMAGEKFMTNKDRYLPRIPLHRFGELVEIADGVVFLCSEKSSYITGTVLNVTGGLLMR